MAKKIKNNTLLNLAFFPVFHTAPDRFYLKLNLQNIMSSMGVHLSKLESGRTKIWIPRSKPAVCIDFLAKRRCQTKFQLCPVSMI